MQIRSVAKGSKHDHIHFFQNRLHVQNHLLPVKSHSNILFLNTIDNSWSSHNEHAKEFVKWP